MRGAYKFFCTILFSMHMKIENVAIIVSILVLSMQPTGPEAQGLFVEVGEGFCSLTMRE